MRWHKLLIVVGHVVVEDLRSSCHLLLLWLFQSSKYGFLRVQVATFNKYLLKLEQVESEVLILLEESVFILSLSEQEELLTHALNGSLLLAL